VLSPVVRMGMRDCTWLQGISACVLCARRGSRKKVLHSCCSWACGVGRVLRSRFLIAI